MNPGEPSQPTGKGIENRPNVPKEAREQQERKDKFERLVRQIEKHVRKSKAGVLEFDEQAAAQLNLDREVLEGVKQALAETNKRVKAGEIKLDDVQVQTDSTAAQVGTRGTANGGVTTVRFHWWGIELLLRDHDTHALLDALKAGGPAVSALLTAIAGPVVGVVAGSVLLLGGVVINFMDQIGEHDGVIFGHLWHPFTPPWVWYQ